VVKVKFSEHNAQNPQNERCAAALAGSRLLAVSFTR
jgi:hypothetical protein